MPIEYERFGRWAHAAQINVRTCMRVGRDNYVLDGVIIVHTLRERYPYRNAPIDTHAMSAFCNDTRGSDFKRKIAHNRKR